jgi:hypothetical protein
MGSILRFNSLSCRSSLCLSAYHRDSETFRYFRLITLTLRHFLCSVQVVIIFKFCLHSWLCAPLCSLILCVSGSPRLEPKRSMILVLSIFDPREFPEMANRHQSI